MKKTRRAVSSTAMSTGLALALAVALGLIGGCAGSAGQKRDAAVQSGEDSTASAQLPGCRTAIDDVTRYCAGDDANTGKCNDAKARTRKSCIN